MVQATSRTQHSLLTLSSYVRCSQERHVTVGVTGAEGATGSAGLTGSMGLTGACSCSEMLHEPARVKLRAHLQMRGTACVARCSNTGAHSLACSQASRELQASQDLPALLVL